MRREDLFMDILGDLDEKYVALAMPRSCGHSNADDTHTTTAIEPVELDGKITTKDRILYWVTHSLGVAAAAILIIGAAVLLIMNWDKIAVREPDRPADQTSLTSTDSIWDDKCLEFETNTDRLRRLYPEMFGLSPEPIGITLGYTTNASGEWVFTLYAINEPWRSDVLPPDMSKMNYIGADDMKCVLNTYNDGDIHFMVRWDPKTGTVEDADEEQAYRLCNLFGMDMTNIEYTKAETRRYYVIDLTNGDLTSDNALNVMKRFYGEWAENGSEKTSLTISPSKSPFDFGGNHTPLRFGETREVFYMECIWGGAPELYVIIKEYPDIMYYAGLTLYHGESTKAIIDTSSEMNIKMKYIRKAALIDSLRTGDISVLGEIELFNIYGEEFENFYKETLDNGFDSDDGKRYITSGESLGAVSRYLVERGSDFVTVGVQFFEQDSVQQYAVGDLAEPNSIFMSLKFTPNDPRDKKSKWSVDFQPLDEVYRKLPIYRITTTSSDDKHNNYCTNAILECCFWIKD